MSSSNQTWSLLKIQQKAVGAGPRIRAALNLLRVKSPFALTFCVRAPFSWLSRPADETRSGEQQSFWRVLPRFILISVQAWPKRDSILCTRGGGWTDGLLRCQANTLPMSDKAVRDLKFNAVNQKWSQSDKAITPNFMFGYKHQRDQREWDFWTELPDMTLAQLNAARTAGAILN